MNSKDSSFNRIISIILIISLLLSLFSGCGSRSITNVEPEVDMPTTEAIIPPTVDTETIVNQIVEDIQLTNKLEDETDVEEIVHTLLVSEYSLCYDVFPAEIYLEDGTQVHGIAYSDFASFFESDDGSRGFFPAGFMAEDYAILSSEIKENQGLEIYNLEYEDERWGFVLAYDTKPFMEHCVINNQYLKYGINENGLISYDVQPYERGYCDEELGALYSYDEGRYLYNPNIGEYINITGNSLFSNLDYASIETEVNRLLTSQDEAFSQEEIRSFAYFARESVQSYLLSCQEETFLGCDVGVLVSEIEQLDPMEFIRITPNGYLIIPIEDEIPEHPSDLAKWIVGVSCGIVVLGSTALNFFIPAMRPASGAITGIAIEVFMQVVVENRAVSDIKWSKVAVSAVSGALMAWACPLGAAKITESVGKATGSLVLSKLAGYGVLTLSNAVVSGATNAVFAWSDDNSGEEIWNAFYMGAIVGACCTAAASLLCEAGHAIGNAVNAKAPNNFLSKAGSKIGTFIGEHQVHLSNTALEDILNPKSVYAAAQAAHDQFLSQVAASGADGVIPKEGGRYAELSPDGLDRHEMPSFSSTGAEVRKDGPAIRMEPADHRLTASYGSSNEAKAYRNVQTELINQGKYHEAIQMDLDNLRELNLYDKYSDAIDQMLKYAESIGWW